MIKYQCLKFNKLEFPFELHSALQSIRFGNFPTFTFLLKCYWLMSVQLTGLLLPCMQIRHKQVLPPQRVYKAAQRQYFQNFLLHKRSIFPHKRVSLWRSVFPARVPSSHHTATASLAWEWLMRRRCWAWLTARTALTCRCKF